MQQYLGRPFILTLIGSILFSNKLGGQRPVVRITSVIYDKPLQDSDEIMMDKQADIFLF